MDRQQMIDALVNDWRYSIRENGLAEIREVLTYGFMGYYNMTDAELKGACHDAGLIN